MLPKVSTEQSCRDNGGVNEKTFTDVVRENLGEGFRKNEETILIKGSAEKWSVFRNLYRCQLKGKINDKPHFFSSSKQWYQYIKAYHEGDEVAMGRIMGAGGGRESKREGDKVKAGPAWGQKKRDVLKCIVEEKLRQNEFFRKTLLGTGGTRLIEDTAHKFWDRGKDGQGSNEMGKILMEARAQGRGEA